MVAMGEIRRTNRELIEARAEVARPGGGRRAQAIRARPARPARPHPSVIALKTELAAPRLPADPEPAAAERRRHRARRRATPCARCARRSAATTGPTLAASSRGPHRPLARPGSSDDRPARQVRAAARGRGRPGLDRARGRDQRDPPQRRAPQCRSACRARRGGQRRGPSTTARGPGGAEARATGSPGCRGARRGARRAPGGRAAPRTAGLPDAAVRVPVEVGAMIRVLLAEDQAMVRGALAAPAVARSRTSRWSPRWPAATRSWRPRAARAPTWRCWTSRCPASTGWRRRAALRGSCRDCKVMIVTTFGRTGYLRRAMAAGAAGFLLKDDPAEALARAIRRVVRGERVVDPALAAAALSRARARSRRASATSSAPRASTRPSPTSPALHLSPATVRNHLSAAMGKVEGATAPRRSARPRRRGGSDASVYHPVTDSDLRGEP